MWVMLSLSLIVYDGLARQVVQDRTTKSRAGTGIGQPRGYFAPVTQDEQAVPVFGLAQFDQSIFCGRIGVATPIGEYSFHSCLYRVTREGLTGLLAQECEPEDKGQCHQCSARQFVQEITHRCSPRLGQQAIPGCECSRVHSSFGLTLTRSVPGIAPRTLRSSCTLHG